MQELFHIENGKLLGFSEKDTVIRIPENVHTIGPGAFRGFAWLTEVILPSGLKSIEAEAFKGCGRLQNLQFPDGLTSIGPHAFQRCNSFTQVILPVSLTNLGICAFRDCGNLETLHIPDDRPVLLKVIKRHLVFSKHPVQSIDPCDVHGTGAHPGTFHDPDIGKTLRL